MKILHVNHLLDPISGGGTAERTYQLARNLGNQNIDCAILTLDIGDTSLLENQLGNIPVFKLPCLNHRYYVLFIWPFKIRRLIAQFDVVHLMGHWTLLNALVAMACFRINKPYVVCPAGSLKPFGRSRILKKIYNGIIGRNIIKKASGWIAITEDEKVDFTAYGINTDSITVIPNGIDPKQYSNTNNSRVLPPELAEKIGGDPYILFLGRLNEIKGPDLLLESFGSLTEKLPEMHLVLAGPDAGLLSSLRNRVLQLDLVEKVHFTGYLKGESKLNTLRNAMCLVIPSRKEAMSLVALEAGITGTPMIFTDQCGLTDFAEKGAGIVTKANKEKIAEAIFYLLNSPTQLNRIGDAVKDYVKGKYTWSMMAIKYINLYKKIIKKPPF